MSKTCDKCGRGPKSSVSVSHSKVATKRTLNINLQSKKIDGKKQKLCTRCLKGLAKAQ